MTIRIWLLSLASLLHVTVVDADTGYQLANRPADGRRIYEFAVPAGSRVYGMAWYRVDLDGDGFAGEVVGLHTVPLRCGPSRCVAYRRVRQQ